MKRRQSKDDEPEFYAIDATQLDREWMEQPELYHRYARRLALCRRRHEEAKGNLEVVTAECAKCIRTHPLRFKLEKSSETAIDKIIPLQPEYQKALKALQQAKYDLDIADVAVKTLDHRKKALENLVDLHGQDYFSTPRAKSDRARQAMDTARKRRARRADVEEDDE